MDLTKAYERAAALWNLNQEKCTLNAKPEEKWIPGSEDFWYIRDIENEEKKIGTEYVRFCAGKKEKTLLFDHKRIAKLITPYCENEVDPFKLPIEVLEVNDNEGVIYLNIKNVVGEFVYDMRSDSLTMLRFPYHANNEVTSPDRHYSLFIKEHNIFCRDNKTGKVTQMTKDGEENLDYGLRFAAAAQKYLSDDPPAMKPSILWSPDSKKFATYRTDRRLLGKLHLVQSVPRDGTPRPNGVSYPYALPGDEHILEGMVHIGDMESGKVEKVHINGEPLILYLLSMFGADNDQAKWTADGKSVYLVRYTRYFKNLQCIIIDADSRTARIPHQDDYKTFCFTEYFGSAGQETYSEPSVRYLPKTNELIWHSETENWAAFYLYDAGTGELKRKLTNGEWTARRIKYVDEEARLLYFTAGGREEGVDPYYQHLYRVSLDGGEPELLTPEHAEHYIRFAPTGKYYIDTWSTVLTTPVTAVFDADGNKLADLEEADLSRLFEHGYIRPQPFEAIARDGKTKIYGIYVKPADFDPQKKYPVVEYIYGGSQRINTPKAFPVDAAGSDPLGGLQTLAQLGFVGVIVDGFSTPLRSKEIHDYIYMHAEECCGIEDRVLAIKQLAEQNPWIDIDRVGIWGASGGGYGSTRAILQFNDFYKVAFSLCGDHDQAKYHAHWGERWCGEYSAEAYKDQANQNFAERLKGHLFLIHGDMDDNVHPSATMAVASALIEANKDFDLLIYPNSAHAVGRFPYVVRKRWDYFVKHLMGENPPKEFQLKAKN